MPQLFNYRNYFINLPEDSFNMGSSIKRVRRIFQKTNFSNPLMRTPTYAYQGVRNVIFPENFAYVLDG